MKTNYQVAYNEEWKKLKTLDLKDISNRLEVKYDELENQIEIVFFDEEYILDFETENIFKKFNKDIPSIMDSIVILNYLTYSSEYVVDDNKWVSLKEIPNGGVLFYPAFYKSSIKPLISEFDNKELEFKNNSTKLGGKKINLGDNAYEFQVLPKIKLCVVYYQGDDEIGSNATVLFNPSIAKLVHIETVIGIGGTVVDKLIN